MVPRTMPNSKLRRQIAWEAARLMYDRQEREYYQAKLKAARRICRGWVKPQDLPSNAEIRDQIELLARMFEGQRRTENLKQMRLEALHLMRLLCRFRPRLIGSTLTGHVRQGSDIDIHVFADSPETVAQVLEQEGVAYQVERKRVKKQGQQRIYTHIHVQGQFPVEITVYPADMAHHVFRSSVTGKPMERASIAQLEQLLRREYPDLDLEAELAGVEHRIDRFQMYEMLLVPLENVQQPRRYHPEGDALYHSLQVFDLAREELPYDEEFLLAALLHDVGKAIDPADHVQAALDALDGYITPRTAWLIAHHMDAQRLREGTLGARARRRLQEHEDYETLLLLCDCDRRGRQVGVPVPTVAEALDYIRELSEMCAE